MLLLLVAPRSHRAGYDLYINPSITRRAKNFVQPVKNL